MRFSPTELESHPCDLCRANAPVKKYEKRGFNIVECGKCGMAYTEPRLTPEKINELYDSDYFQGHGFDRSVNYVSDVKHYTAEGEHYTLHDWDLDTIRERLKTTINAPKLLEIGCGTGVFLDKARKDGFEVEGLELSEYAANFVREMGIRVQTESIESASFSEASWDVIVMREVIEHLPHPLDSLKTIHRWLKPGGVLFMATGNYDCPERKLKKSEWFYFMPEGHLYYFSNRTMEKYLVKSGYREIDVTNQGDMLMQQLLDRGILEPGKFAPGNFAKRAVFLAVRSVNHFISSGMRIYAVK